MGTDSCGDVIPAPRSYRYLSPTAQRHPGASWLRFTAPGINGASAALNCPYTTFAAAAAAAAAAADQPVDAYSDLGPELKLIYTIRTGIPSSIL
ncbi:hypothetical protein CTAM01_10621 [Colletotrichum tamarilloi]|uniref:Uncharacterized protein n=1 Tax=Colletotrichum tamarilloi TaxID=1209934 RepID=A0ABQ9R0G1_9PEZI|nr:uncharacterized protein CTAM01_10621 [Colletotrichum tamarilloi]KAK1490695.1 hypothetical protein CTAM01_10621 [Colletotrichum tamarilloi]